MHYACMACVCLFIAESIFFYFYLKIKQHATLYILVRKCHVIHFYFLHKKFFNIREKKIRKNSLFLLMRNACQPECIGVIHLKKKKTKKSCMWLMIMKVNIWFESKCYFHSYFVFCFFFLLLLCYKLIYGFMCVY